MRSILLKLEKELLKFNNSKARSIPTDILQLLENPERFCWEDLTEEELDETFCHTGFCLCKKCLLRELKECSDWEPFNPNKYINSAFIN